MECPSCNGETRVTDSRSLEDRRWRRRKCLVCRKNFNTYEIYADEYKRLRALETVKKAVRE